MALIQCRDIHASVEVTGESKGDRAAGTINPLLGSKNCREDLIINSRALTAAVVVSCTRQTFYIRLPVHTDLGFTRGTSEDREETPPLQYSTLRDCGSGKIPGGIAALEIVKRGHPDTG
ncbi:hypothetical protein FKM82_024557 [Ascaphus truei]